MMLKRIALPLLALGALASGEARAQAPSLLPVQGVLTDAAGGRLEGTVSVTFALYDQAVGGTAFFSETVNVEVEAGVFTTLLGGSGRPLDLANFQRGETYLGLAVAEDPEMTPRLRLATAPYAAYAEQSGDSNTLGGVDSTGYAATQHGHELSELAGVAASAHGHPFSALSGVPPGLADGDQDTTYAAGAGLALSGTVMSIDPTATQRRVVGTCAAGSSMRAIGVDGAVTCEPDNDTTYTAGAGLSLSGTQLSVDNYADLARTDGGAGNQAFDTNTLLLDYTNNRVGVRMTTPDEELDVAGDVEVTGQYFYSSPRTFYKYLGASDFYSQSSNWVNTGQYGYANTNLSVLLYARPDLPQGAEVTRLICYYYDNSTAIDIEDFDIYFRRRAYSSASVTNVISDINDPTNVTSSTVFGVSATGSVEIDKLRNEYYIYVLFDLTTASTANSAGRFYGCRVDYRMDRATSD